MAGVQQAKAGLLGFGPAALIASIALGGLIMAGKSAIAISQEHFIAENNLANALKTRRVNTKLAQDDLYAFIQANRDFISNNNDVINAWANLTREGVKQKDISHLMSIAMNIQATEGGTLTDAVTKLQQAEIGRNRGLATQVGLVLKAIPAHATLAQKEKIVAENIAAITKAYGDQPPKLDPLVVATNHLKTDWENIAEKYGPDLITQIAGVAEAIDKGLPSWLNWATTAGNVVSQLLALIPLAHQAGWNATSGLFPNDAAGGATPQHTRPVPGAVGAGGLIHHRPVTINVNGAHNPAATARAVTQQLRRITAV